MNTLPTTSSSAMPAVALPFPGGGTFSKADEFKILVVDDEQTTRLRLEHLLKKHGFIVSSAKDGREALAAVKRQKFDLVLSDIQMPAMDGLRLVRMLRLNYSVSDLPIILMTSADGSEQVLNAFDAGANDYIDKPLDNEVVLVRVKNQLLTKKALRALRESEERYALATRGTNDGIWDWNLVTGELYLSPRWREMVGADSNWQPSGGDWMELIHHEDRRRVADLLEAHLCSETDHFETELRMQDCKKEFRWMLCRGLAVHDENGVACRIAGSLTDITEGKVADALTGLPNRVLFLDRVQNCVEHLKRNPDYCFGVIYMDVDDFKLINDHLGHEAGDEFLVSVAKRIDASLRKSEAIFARLGGDEFAVLVEKVNSINELISIANRVHEQMSSPFTAGEREILTRASMGVVLATQDSDPSFASMSAETLLSQADAAMYRAKGQTETPYCIFESHLLAENAMRLELGGELKQAIKRNELSVHYQPIVDIASERTLGFEALLRWKHPVHGNVSPNRFVPIAESNGLINEIGEWVLMQACRQLVSWNRKFETELSISVNVSIRQFANAGFLRMLSLVLEKTQVRPELLRLEVTESVLMQNTEETICLLHDIRAMGVTIGIDDFGTGYSSLSYLHKMPMDVLKIDRSFVCNMNQSEKHMAIVRSIVALANSLNLQIVAEGIETYEQFVELKRLGCQMAQGYLMSRPVSASESPNLIDKFWDLNPK